jgi:hypothetical protein
MVRLSLNGLIHFLTSEKSSKRSHVIIVICHMMGIFFASRVYKLIFCSKVFLSRWNIVWIQNKKIRKMEGKFFSSFLPSFCQFCEYKTLGIQVVNYFTLDHDWSLLSYLLYRQQYNDFSADKCKEHKRYVRTCFITSYVFFFLC